MNSVRLASLAALALALAACGGGGGGGPGSTPNPPGPGPTPTPGPTPAPAPTPAPTPAATPAPTPPTGVNDDLIAPLLSESFVNDAVTGTTKLGGDGLLQSTAARSNVQFDYNQQSNSYTVKTGGRSQTFAPADLKDSGSDRLQIYLKQSGSTADSLVLTTSKFVPGHSLRYVGAGAWQRTIAETSGSLDAFAYGVQSPGSGVPRNGTARYQVGLLGVGAWAYALTSISGQGGVDIDFGKGTLKGMGEFYEVNTAQPGSPASYSGNWSMDATLASASNAIDGTIALSLASGTFDGRFYGPIGQEFGGAFAVSGEGIHGKGSAVGALIGYRATSENLNASLADLKFEQEFYSPGPGVMVDFDKTTGLTAPGTFGGYYGPQTTVKYDPAAGRLNAYADDVLLNPASARDGAASDGRFDVYRQSVGGADYVAHIYRLGSANSEVQLTYANFGRFIRIDDPTPGDNVLRHTEKWFLFGTPTPLAQIPTTGTASYSGGIYGTAIDQTDPGRVMSVDGNAKFNLNFGAGTADGALQFFLSAPDYARRELANVTLDGTLCDCGSGSFGLVGTLGSSGAFEAHVDVGLNFYGPTARELVGNFGGTFTMPGTHWFGGHMSGIIATDKD